MNWLLKQRLRLHRYLLGRALKQPRPIRASRPFEAIRSIGIFFDATELDERESVLKYKKALKAEGKKVSLMGYFNNSIKDQNYTFPHFNKLDLDFALRPKKKEVIAFIEEPFDLLLIAYPRTHFIAEYIGAMSAAHMRVGPVSEHTSSFDLMYDGGDETRIEDFFAEIEQILKKTVVPHEAA